MDQRLKEAIDGAQRITFLTGAGISVPSGLPQYQGNRDAKEAYDAIRGELEEKIRNAEPSVGHLFIAGLYKAGKDVHVVTQNVDGLHQKAGLPQDRVHEVHGNRERGDVVEFGRSLPKVVWGEALAAMILTDLVVIIGTSLQVSPVNILPEYSLDKGIPVWIINKTATILDWRLGNRVIHDDLVNVFGAPVEESFV